MLSTAELKKNLAALESSYILYSMKPITDLYRENNLSLGSVFEKTCKDYAVYNGLHSQVFYEQVMQDNRHFPTAVEPGDRANRRRAQNRVASKKYRLMLKAERSYIIEKIILLSTLERANAILFPLPRKSATPQTELDDSSKNENLTQIMDDLGISEAQLKDIKPVLLNDDAAPTVVVSSVEPPAYNELTHTATFTIDQQPAAVTDDGVKKIMASENLILPVTATENIIVPETAMVDDVLPPTATENYIFPASVTENEELFSDLAGMNDIELMTYLMPELVFDDNLAMNLFNELNF